MNQQSPTFDNSMDYKVRFVEAGGATLQHRVLQADDPQSLRRRLEQEGHVVLKIVESPQPRQRHAGRPAAFALFCREIRTLIRAGMTVVEAVDTLCSRGDIARGREDIAPLLRANLQSGQALSQALANLAGSPPVLIAAVRAGERTSNLVEALDEFLRFDELVQQLRRKVVSAAIYPALVTILGVGIAFFLLVVILPSFARMYQNLRTGSGTMSQTMVVLSVWVSEHRTSVLAGAGLFVLVLATLIRKGWHVRLGGYLGEAIPALRRRIRDFQLAMFYQALALLLKGGYPMVEALDVAGRSALSQRLRSGTAAARQKVMEGNSVSVALASAALCDEVDRRLFGAAERNGDFHQAADVVSRMHAERFELFVERATRVVEPVLLLGVALLVGTIVVAMYLPVFDMATRLR